MKKTQRDSSEAFAADDNKNVGRESKNRLSHSSIALRISVISIAVNVALTVFKIIAGIVGNSFAMISDAVHSASDVFSTFIVIIGVKIAAKKADRNHPYGHERFECVAAILLAVMLGATGVMIGVGGLQRIIDGSYATVAVPTVLALSAAVVSVVIKEAMFWLTYVSAKKINSGALKADAWHHRSDALSSVGSFIGILFAMIGWPIMDSIAALVICLLILKAAVGIFKESIDKMTDEACDKKTERSLKEFIVGVEGVAGLDLLRTRKFGDRLYVEVEISADGLLSLYEAHDIADKVHDGIEFNFPQVKHCTVHTNPREMTSRPQTQSPSELGQGEIEVSRLEHFPPVTGDGQSGQDQDGEDDKH